MLVEEVTEKYYKHCITIGKTDFCFKLDKEYTKAEVLAKVASQLVYIDRDVKTREILFYKKSSGSCSRGSGYMDFYFEFKEDDFTKDINIGEYNESNEKIISLFTILLIYFGQN